MDRFCLFLSSREAAAEGLGTFWEALVSLLGPLWDALGSLSGQLWDAFGALGGHFGGVRWGAVFGSDFGRAKTALVLRL